MSGRSIYIDVTKTNMNILNFVRLGVNNYKIYSSISLTTIDENSLVVLKAD